MQMIVLSNCLLYYSSFYWWPPVLLSDANNINILQKRYIKCEYKSQYSKEFNPVVIVVPLINGSILLLVCLFIYHNVNYIYDDGVTRNIRSSKKRKISFLLVLI